MGERKKRLEVLNKVKKEVMAVDTVGGLIQVHWDQQSQATPNGQLVFFSEFLQATGLYQAWLKSCPLVYTSGNAFNLTDILGTWLLAILAGHKRYAHITALRGDGVCPDLLGMTKIISEDALRRALARMDAEQSANWLKPQLLKSVQGVLDQPWILDIDTTIKTVFGKQDGAQVSYNPHKPGRPSHALHTYFIAHLRLVLDVVVSPGLAHSAANLKPGLIGLLDQFPEGQKPALVRGDCAFGNEPFIKDLEQRAQPYLFKIKQTAGVKKLLARLFRRPDWVAPKSADQGWWAIEDTLQLAGWDKPRRVVALRRAIKQDIALTKKDAAQYELLQPDDTIAAWEYAVLITNTDYAGHTIAQLYRDRADCENGFDELKNQWGWGGFTTQDLERCQTSARAVALIYNWWSWYCRAAKPGARMEAITSRPLLLAGVARMTKHAGQTLLHLTPLHAGKEALMKLISNIRAAINHVKTAAEQFPHGDPWKAFIDYVTAKIIDASINLSSKLPAYLLGNCRI